MKKLALVAAGVLATALTACAQVTVKHIQTDKSPIATGVWAGDTFYLSGQLANPVTPADPAKGTPADFGDTKAQTLSIMNRIQAALREQGLDMKDIVKMTVFLAADPKTSKLDFQGLQAGYTQFFGTKEQPNKPARSTIQVAALVSPTALAEIEVIAVRSK